MGHEVVMRRDRSNIPRRRAGSILPLALLLAAGIVMLGTSGPAFAQSFNEAVAGALADNCAGLSSGGSFSESLDRICTIPPSGSGSASGGIFAIDNRIGGTEEERRILRRLRERRETRTGAASADPGTRGFGVFGSVEYTAFDKDETRFESGYRSDILGMTVGGDYRFSDALVAGAAFNYNREMGDFEGANGGFDVDSFGPLLYAGLRPFENAFIDVTLGYSRKDYSFERNAFLALAARTAAGKIRGDTEGNEYKAGINTGYDFLFGRFTVGPRLGLNVRHTRIEGFAERGDSGLEVVYEDQDRTSVTSVAGVYTSLAISTGFGVLVPQATVEYIHEFSDDQRTLGFRFVGDPGLTRITYKTDDPDRNYFTVSTGAVLALPNGWSPFINYRALVGYSDRSSHTVSLGLRVSF